MFRLALRTLRFRKGSFVASFIALFFGAAVVMACGGLMETGIRLNIPPERLAAAPIVVTRQQTTEERTRLDNDILTKIQAIDGVEQAVSDISFPAYVLRDGKVVGDGESFGHGWSSVQLAPYESVLDNISSAPLGSASVTIDQKTAELANAKQGDTVTVAAGGTINEYIVRDVVRNSVVSQGALFFSDETAAKLLGKSNAPDLIGVYPSQNTDVAALEKKIDETLNDKSILTLRGDDRGEAEFAGAASARESLVVIGAVFGGMVAMVAVFVAGSTLGLLVQQRQREMALLKAIGATPGQLRRMILGETMVIAVLAAALATVPGFYIGEFLLSRLAASGAVPANLIFFEGIVPITAAIALSLITAMVAAFVASQGAVRVRPTEALAESGLQKRWFSWIKLVFILITLGGGFALGLVTMLAMHGPVAASTSGPSSILWAVGLALLAPGLTGILFFFLRWPTRLVTGLSGYLATLNARTRRIRMAAAVVPIMLSTGIATSMIYQQTTQSRVAFQTYTKDLQADVVLVSPTGGFKPDFVTEVAKQPGVAGASALITSSGFFVHGDKVDEDGENTGGVEDDSFTLQGVTADGAETVFNVPVREGSLRELRGDSVALPIDYAERQGARIGQTVRVQFGDGAQSDLKVVALLTSPQGFESAFVPADVLARHTSSGLVPQILVRAASDTNPTDLAATLQSLESVQPGLEARDRQALDNAFAKQEQTGAWINYMLSAMIIGYTVISLVNTLVVATAERKREFATQRLIGATRAQIMRMIAVEALLISVCGIILGGIVSVLTLIPFSVALNGSVWPQGPLWIYFVVVGFATLLTLAATLFPTWMALRIRPVEAAATRE